MLSKEYLKLLKSKLGSPIIDLIVFGSMVKGGLKPQDVDVLAICSDDSDLTSIKRRFDELPEKVHITLTNLKDLVKTHSLLRQAAIHEGFSIRFNKPVREILGFKSHTLFTFSLNNLNKSDKVRFQYALYGRGSAKAVLEENSGRQVAPGAILIPVNKESELDDFFRNWKIQHSKERWMVSSK